MPGPSDPLPPDELNNPSLNTHTPSHNTSHPKQTPLSPLLYPFPHQPLRRRRLVGSSLDRARRAAAHPICRLRGARAPRPQGPVALAVLQQLLELHVKSNTNVAKAPLLPSPLSSSSSLLLLSLLPPPSFTTPAPPTPLPLFHQSIAHSKTRALSSHPRRRSPARRFQGRAFPFHITTRAG